LTHSQDPERVTSETLELLLRLRRTDELNILFRGQVLGGKPGEAQTQNKPGLKGLTFIHTAAQKDAKRLLTTDFNADPNVLATTPDVAKNVASET
jgi:hypothetical protein